MAVLPKKFDKSSRVDEYINYMVGRIEYWAQTNDKKVVELSKQNAELTEENQALKLELGAFEKELAEIKQILISGGFYGNV